MSEACKFYQNLKSWDPEQLDEAAVGLNIFTEFANKNDIPVTSSAHAYTCLLASMGFPEHRILRTVSRSIIRPSTFKCKVAFYFNELGLDRAALVRLLSTHSRLLDYSIEKTVQPRVDFFMEYLQIDAVGLGRVAQRHPRLLWASFEYDIETKIQLLSDVVDSSAVPGIVSRVPSVFAMSELTLQEKMTQLVNVLELESQSELAPVLTRAPTLLARNINGSVALAVEALRSSLKSKEAAKVIIVRQPQVLSLSCDHIRRKIAALAEAVGVPAIEHNPGLLTISMTRISTRVALARASGLVVQGPDQPHRPAATAGQQTRLRGAQSSTGSRQETAGALLRSYLLLLTPQAFARKVRKARARRRVWGDWGRELEGTAYIDADSSAVVECRWL